MRNRAAAGSESILYSMDQLVPTCRLPARKEIDFVAIHLGDVAVEGKYTEGVNWRGDAATVGASPWRCSLVTCNVLEVEEGRGWAVPAGLLAYPLDTWGRASRRLDGSTIRRLARSCAGRHAELPDGQSLSDDRERLPVGPE